MFIFSVCRDNRADFFHDNGLIELFLSRDNKTNQSGPNETMYVEEMKNKKEASQIKKDALKTGEITQQRISLFFVCFGFCPFEPSGTEARMGHTYDYLSSF